MCMPKAPKIQQAPPPPTMEKAATNDVDVARQSERRRAMGAVNTRTSILGGRDEQGRKTLLGM